MTKTQTVAASPVHNVTYFYGVKHAVAMVTEAALAELAAKVADAMGSGWQPCGGVALIYECGRWHAFQAMTKAA